MRPNRTRKGPPPQRNERVQEMVRKNFARAAEARMARKAMQDAEIIDIDVKALRDAEHKSEDSTD